MLVTCDVLVNLQLVTVVDWLAEPEVPTIVISYVPAGVPEGAPAWLPPLHATVNSIKLKASIRVTAAR